MTIFSKFGMYFILACLGVLLHLCRGELYQYGPAYDATLPTADDVSSDAINLDVPFVFFGVQYTELWINSNGPITFSGPFSDFTEETGSIPTPYLAALWDDVNTAHGGAIYYRVSRDPVLLDMVSRDILDANRDLTPELVVVVTWAAVRQFYLTLTEVNTFQVVLATDGVSSYAMFNYKNIEWVHPGVAALNSGTGTIINLPGSGNPVSMKALSSYSNICMPGRVLIRTDPQVIDYLHCCSVTTAGEVHQFSGGFTNISPNLINTDIDIAITEVDDPCLFKATIKMNQHAQEITIAHVKFSMIFHAKKSYARYYKISRSDTPVTERGSGSAKGAIELPWYSPSDGSDLAVTGDYDDGRRITSKICPYGFSYAPVGLEPAMKVIIGNAIYQGPLTGLCV